MDTVHVAGLPPCSSSAGGLESSGLWGGRPCPTPPCLTRLSFSRSFLPQGEKKVQGNTAWGTGLR